LFWLWEIINLRGKLWTMTIDDRWIESQWKFLQECLEAFEDFTELARFSPRAAIFFVLWSPCPSFYERILVQLYDMYEKNNWYHMCSGCYWGRQGVIVSTHLHVEAPEFAYCAGMRYLAALITQSFLDIGSVSLILDSIINRCLQLWHIIEQEDGGFNLIELDHITEVCKIVHACRSMIYAICSSDNA
jgi:hypothetical protein